MATLFSKHNKLSDFWRLMLQYYLEISIFLIFFIFNMMLYKLLLLVLYNSLLQKMNGTILGFSLTNHHYIFLYIYMYIVLQLFMGFLHNTNA